MGRLKNMGILNKKKAGKTCLLVRFLAESNRRTRFCRPLPSHSAKEPCTFRTAKI